MTNENYYAAQSIVDTTLLWLPVQAHSMISVKGHEYQILVSCPAGPAPEFGWPLACILDHSLFNAVAPVLHKQSQAGRYGLVVGIGYKGADRRGYDYTPPVDTMLPSAATAQPVDTGGADDFLAFMLHELKPWLARNWHVDARRQSLAGHSLGGLFALYTLFQHPAAFQNYLVSSPSVWWADRFLLLAAQLFVTHQEGRRLVHPVRVGLTVGEYEQSLSPAEQQRDPVWQEQQRSRRAARRMVDGNLELALALQHVDGVDIGFQILKGLTHSRAGPEALARQLSLLFP